jgi:hypothetical protein
MARALTRTGLGAFLALVLCAAAAPAEAGTVYVPLAGDTVVQGVHYTTRVWVSNHSVVPRRFTTRFVAADAKAGASSAHTVGPQSTMLLTDLAGGGKAGILELSGAPQLVVNAQLVSMPGAAVRTALPVISSANVVLPGGTASAQGLVRSGAEVSGLSVFNLGQSAASCTISAWTAAGKRLGPPQSLRLPARAHQVYPDILAAFGQEAVAGARVATTCNKPFHAFAMAFRPATGEAYLLPAGESATSVLQPLRDDGNPGRDGGGGGNAGGGGGPGDGGGDSGKPAAGCPTGASCYTQNGAFFTTTAKEPYRYYRWNVPAGTQFKRIEVDFQMTLHKWDKNRNGFYTMFYLPRGGKWLGHGVALLVARQKGVITAETTLDLNGNRVQAVRDKKAQLQPGQTYHVRYVYDAENRRLRVLVKDSKGRVVSDMNEPLQAKSRAIVSNGWFGVQFSDPYIKGTDHVPMWATWRNLVIAGYR